MIKESYSPIQHSHKAVEDTEEHEAGNIPLLALRPLCEARCLSKQLHNTDNKGPKTDAAE